MSNPWFRLYSEMPDDERIEEIAFEDRWHYVNILCMKCAGTLDKDYQSADMRERKIIRQIGLDRETASFLKTRLMEVGLIDDDWQPQGWAKRQYASDSSTERTRKYRDKKKKDAKQRHGDVTATKCDAIDTDTETEETTPPVSPPQKKLSTGTRLPDDWTLPREWILWAKEHAPDIDIQRESDMFRDHFLASSGQNARKRDWLAAWRNWCRRPQTKGVKAAAGLAEY